MNEQSTHQGVLTDEVVAYLAPKSGGIYLDGTFGGGGHSLAILQASSPRGQVYGVDRDPSTAVFAEQLIETYPDRFKFRPVAYSQVNRSGTSFDGAVIDLGLSTDQLDNAGRGFSFQVNEPLDMRFDASHGQTAAQLLNQTSVTELERIFRDYGEDRHSGQLARKIAANRRVQPIHTTFDLVRLIGTTEPKVLARIFQALRIAVNDELGELRRGLTVINSVLKPSGRLVVISFHSLEDRIVKEFIRNQMKIVTKKPILAIEAEVKLNPRARSAKLRVGEKE